MVPPHEVGAGLAPALSSSPVAQDGCVQRPRPRLVATASSCISSSGYASSVSFSPVCPSTTPAIKVSQVWAGYDRRPLRPAAGATGRPSTCVGATRRLSIRFIHPIRCPKTHTGLATPNRQAGEGLASSHIMRQARAPVSPAFGSGRGPGPALRGAASAQATRHRLRPLPRPHLPDDPVRPAVRADYVTRRLLERVSFLQRRGRPVLVLTPPLAANHPLVFCHARLLLVVELLALVRAIVRRLEPRILHVAVTRLPAAPPTVVHARLLSVQSVPSVVKTTSAAPPPASSTTPAAPRSPRRIAYGARAPQSPGPSPRSRSPQPRRRSDTGPSRSRPSAADRASRSTAGASRSSSHTPADSGCTRSDPASSLRPASYSPLSSTSLSSPRPRLPSRNSPPSSPTSMPIEKRSRGQGEESEVDDNGE